MIRPVGMAGRTLVNAPKSPCTHWLICGAISARGMAVASPSNVLRDKTKKSIVKACVAAFAMVLVGVAGCSGTVGPVPTMPPYTPPDPTVMPTVKPAPRPQVQPDYATEICATAVDALSIADRDSSISGIADHVGHIRELTTWGSIMVTVDR